MKITLILFALIWCSILDSNLIADSLDVEIAKTRQMILLLHRFRKIDGKVVDLNRECFAAAKRENARNCCGDWELINGKVIQVLPEGLLCSVSNSWDDDTEKRNVFLKNYPSENTVVDGDSISILSKNIGRYSYTNTGGSTSTVEKFDCGETPNSKEIKAFLDADEARKKELEEIKVRRNAQAEDQRRMEQEEAIKRQEEIKKSNDAKIISIQKKNAESGYPTAQYDLGMRYLKGDGVEKNELTALGWLKKSANQGNVFAQEQLKKMNSK